MVTIPDIWKGVAIGLASGSVPIILSWAAGWIPKEKESSFAIATFASIGMSLLTLAITRPPTTAVVGYSPRRYTSGLVQVD
ncbi:MAG: hypothetical protein ACTSSP_07520 [Candidatus Asgardarchaeia archaeon]